MKLGIIGLGHVGKQLYARLSSRAPIVTYDNVDQQYPTDELAGCDLVFICVDTPMSADGACDVSNVRNAVLRVPCDRVLIKSTVAPGTVRSLIEMTGKRICYSPEFFGEAPFSGADWPDLLNNAGFVIVGGAAAVREEAIDFLTPVYGPGARFFQCEAIEAELIKYMENSFLALKVTFVNEFYEICEQFGAGWNTVREGWLLDPRMGRSHTAVFVGDRGFGGRCLPKDIHAIIRSAETEGYRPDLLREVVASNHRFRGEGSA